MITFHTSNYVIKHDNGNNFMLYLQNGSYDTKRCLYESIIKTIPQSFSFINPETQELHFQANKIQLLLDFLKNNRVSWEQCLLLIGFLSKQIQELEKRGYAIVGFNLQDVIMLDESVFLFVNNEYLFPFNNKYVTLVTPLKKPYFSSPEILQLTKIPAKIHYKSCYYSLASLVVCCFLQEYVFKGNEVKKDHELETILKPLFATKMYWFLKRCFVLNPENRQMLFI
uniref:Protein kinase domain-containing protein n=1 Tax=viral metagenome TaxID=1070528 RepID=A0A6C0E1U1_9ZZZZ